MKYSNIISDFTWSYSRISQFEMCPYAFLLNYIKHTPKRSLFFSDYGSFIHKLIEQYLKKEISKEQLVTKYLEGFKYEVRGKAPSKEIFKSYFGQGMQYLNNIKFPYENILAVEEQSNFYIGDYEFTGIIDCIAKDGDNIVIVDNKARALKPRSKRSKPTKSDGELDKYLRQLYLYSIPIQAKYDVFPARLEFNCFRTGELISEPFKEENFDKAKQWAIQGIQTIIENDNWSPKIDYWQCKHLCSLNAECEYYRLCFDNKKGGK